MNLFDTNNKSRDSFYFKFILSSVVLVGICGQPNGLSLIFPFFNFITFIVISGSSIFAIRHTDIIVSKNILYFCLFLFGVVIWSFFSLSYAQDPLFGLRILVSVILKVFIFLICIFLIKDSKIFKSVLKMFFLGGFFFSLTGIILVYSVVCKVFEPSLHIGGETISGSLEYNQNLYYYSGLGFVKASSSLLELIIPRLQSFFIEPGYFTFFVESSVFISLAYYNTLKNCSIKIIVIVGIITQILAIILSLSPAGFFCLFSGYFFYFKYANNYGYFQASFLFTKRILVWGFIIIVSSFLINKNFLPGLYQAIFVDHFIVENGPSSADERKVAFDMGLNLFKTHPIFGIGFNQVRILSKGFGINNSFLTIAAELGLLGFILYVGMNVMLFKVINEVNYRVSLFTKTDRRIAASLSAALISQTIHLLFIDVNWTFHYWLTIGLLFGYIQVIKPGVY